uniref:MABP domain-containing protein n=1 Tax=Macrostomum lignano TaxID=282301 RepID=A0A1I8IV80_9PLAT
PHLPPNPPANQNARAGSANPCQSFQYSDSHRPGLSRGDISQALHGLSPTCCTAAVAVLFNPSSLPSLKYTYCEMSGDRPWKAAQNRSVSGSIVTFGGGNGVCSAVISLEPDETKLVLSESRPPLEDRFAVEPRANDTGVEPRHPRRHSEDMLGIRHQIPMAGQERDSATSADSVYQSRPVSQVSRNSQRLSRSLSLPSQSTNRQERDSGVANSQIIPDEDDAAESSSSGSPRTPRASPNSSGAEGDVESNSDPEWPEVDGVRGLQIGPHCESRNSRRSRTRSSDSSAGASQAGTGQPSAPSSGALAFNCATTPGVELTGPIGGEEESV